MQSVLIVSKRLVADIQTAQVIDCNRPKAVITPGAQIVREEFGNFFLIVAIATREKMEDRSRRLVQARIPSLAVVCRNSAKNTSCFSSINDFREPTISAIGGCLRNSGNSTASEARLGSG